ncbi:MAG: hypothetical protein H7249_07445 [Chitinophagaceae bacterium]|nr:hypothetical protein [Oligoflexus sp.]
MSDQHPRYFRDPSDPIYTPADGPRGTVAPYRGLYEIMGEDNIKTMLRDFYRKLGTSKIAGMFTGDLDKASERSALFFIGLMGGPPLYHQTYGPPRMRARHIPFRITEDFRQEWLRLFNEVLDDSDRYQFPDAHLPEFRAFLEGFSSWMVNSEGP